MKKALMKTAILMFALSICGKANSQKMCSVGKSVCPNGYICLTNAKLINAKNFRTEIKNNKRVNLCDIVLTTEQNKKIVHTENYCNSLEEIKFLFGERVTLMIKNNSVIHINWCPISDKYPEFIFGSGGCMRPLQLKLKN